MDNAKRAVTGTCRPYGGEAPLDERQRDKFMRACPDRLRPRLRAELDGLDRLLTGYDDFQKLCLIYNMVTTGVTYDLRAGHRGTCDLLISRRGVCDDISEAMVMLAGHCCHDSAVYRIVGWQKGDAYGHGWNVVEVTTPTGRGVWFLDATSDLGGHWSCFLRGAKAFGELGVKWNGSRFPQINEEDCGFRPYRNPLKEKELAAWFAGAAERIVPPRDRRHRS